MVVWQAMPEAHSGLKLKPAREGVMLKLVPGTRPVKLYLPSAPVVVPPNGPPSRLTPESGAPLKATTPEIEQEFEEAVKS